MHIKQYFIFGQITRCPSASMGGRRKSPFVLQCRYFKMTKDKNIQVKQFIKLPCLMQAHIITARLYGQERTIFFIEITALGVLGMKSHTASCKSQCSSRTNFPFLLHVNFLQEKRIKDPRTMHCLFQQMKW